VSENIRTKAVINHEEKNHVRTISNAVFQHKSQTLLIGAIGHISKTCVTLIMW